MQNHPLSGLIQHVCFVYLDPFILFAEESARTDRTIVPDHFPVTCTWKLVTSSAAITTAVKSRLTYLVNVPCSFRSGALRKLKRRYFHRYGQRSKNFAYTRVPVRSKLVEDRFARKEKTGGYGWMLRTRDRNPDDPRMNLALSLSSSHLTERSTRAFLALCKSWVLCKRHRGEREGEGKVQREFVRNDAA